GRSPSASCPWTGAQAAPSAARATAAAHKKPFAFPPRAVFARPLTPILSSPCARAHAPANLKEPVEQAGQKARLLLVPNGAGTLIRDGGVGHKGRQDRVVGLDVLGPHQAADHDDLLFAVDDDGLPP